jgi:hypothetical protein
MLPVMMSWVSWILCDVWDMCPYDVIVDGELLCRVRGLEEGDGVGAYQYPVGKLHLSVVYQA